MSSQKQAARKNIKKAQAARHDEGGKRGSGMSTAEKDRLYDTQFAFPDQRKEPLNDAAHVRNAIARFDQVEGVSDAERDEAWKRILRAADRFDVEVGARSWRELTNNQLEDPALRHVLVMKTDLTCRLQHRVANHVQGGDVVLAGLSRQFLASVIRCRLRFRSIGRPSSSRTLRLPFQRQPRQHR